MEQERERERDAYIDIYMCAICVVTQQLESHSPGWNKFNKSLL